MVKQSQPRCTLQRVPVNAQGYTKEGHYYGTGKPLFFAFDERFGIDAIFRAASRDAAKAQLTAKFPTINFYS